MNDIEKKEVEAEALKYWKEHQGDHLKHWRAWGSWFSWGSPVGLGLFLVALAFCVWLLGLTFNWG